MKRNRRLFQPLFLIVPFLMAAHEPGCGADSSTNPIPDDIKGCQLLFTRYPGEEGGDSAFSAPLRYTFLQEGRVEGSGAGGTFKSVSYSYDKPVIVVEWNAGATETITLLHREGEPAFDYVGRDGSRVVRAYGTYEVIDACAGI